MRVAFIIRNLQSGGAERQLIALVRGLDRSRFDVTVITYYPGGALEGELHGLPNVRLVSAAKRGRWDLLGFFKRLYGLIRAAQPDVIHGYMYGANELALLLGRLAGARVVWGVRASGLDLKHYDWATRLLFKSGACLSSRADAVIANSEAGRRFHVGLGYPGHKFDVIANGIDTEVYRFIETGRRALRALWEVGDGETLIGVVARIDPMKDHGTFLRAAAELTRRGCAARFVVVGAAASTETLTGLKNLANDMGIGSRIVWAGVRRDMSAVYSAIDIVTSSSAFGEGFSNSLAEAMACERMCVATDVGDAGMVLGDAGDLVPAKQPDALASVWERLLRLTPQERRARGRAARARIVANFSIGTLASRTADVLCRIAP